jgi:transcriptional regulator with XRE-family HTH domain
VGIREFGAYLQSARDDQGLTIAAVARAAGIDPSYLSRLEKGDAAYKSVGVDVLRSLASVLDVPEQDLDARLYDRPLPGPLRPQPEPSREIPAYDIGTIAAGPRGRTEVHHWESVPLSQTRGRMLRAAIVSGDCMGDEVRPGDTVLFDRNPNPRDGQLVVAVLLDEGPDEKGQGVLKRFFKLDGKVKLAPNVGDPIIVAADRVRIEGVVVEVRRRYAA